MSSPVGSAGLAGGSTTEDRMPRLYTGPFITQAKYDALWTGIPDVDWARLAAFIDGEGCIYIVSFSEKGKHKSKRHQISISITNTDGVLPLWLKNTFKCG